MKHQPFRYYWYILAIIQQFMAIVIIYHIFSLPKI